MIPLKAWQLFQNTWCIFCIPLWVAWLLHMWGLMLPPAVSFFWCEKVLIFLLVSLVSRTCTAVKFITWGILVWPYGAFSGDRPFKASAAFSLSRSSLTPQTSSGAASCRNACPPSWWSPQRVERWRAGSYAGLLKTSCFVRIARRRGDAMVGSCALTLHSRGAVCSPSLSLPPSSPLVLDCASASFKALVHALQHTETSSPFNPGLA